MQQSLHPKVVSGICMKYDFWLNYPFRFYNCIQVSLKQIWVFIKAKKQLYALKYSKILYLVKEW